MTQRLCDLLDCRAQYEAKRKDSRFCSAKCVKRAQRGAPAVVSDATVARQRHTLDGAEGAENRPSSPHSGLLAATRRALSAVDRAETPLGQAAMILAARIDAGNDTGAGLASLTREWRSTLDAATANAVREASPAERRRDELARRREMRGA